MNKLLLIAVLVFTTFNVTAQIKDVTSKINKEENSLTQISKINLLGNLIGQLNKVTNKDFYTVSYKDFKNNDRSDIKSFDIGNKETVKQFRDIMLTMIDNKTNKKVIELEGKTISFNRKSNSIETLITNKLGETSKMKWITKKHIKILFPENKLM